MVFRLGETECDIVDLTNLKYDFINRRGEVSQHRVTSFGVVPTQVITEQRFSDRRQPLRSAERAALHAEWKALRLENAPFRIVENDALRSAPITCFDDYVLSCVTEEWQRSNSVIAYALAYQEERHPYQKTGDVILFARLRMLAETGRIEYRGDMNIMHMSEVRL